jgi:hypothetical protein
VSTGWHERSLRISCDSITDSLSSVMRVLIFVVSLRKGDTPSIRPETPNNEILCPSRQGGAFLFVANENLWGTLHRRSILLAMLPQITPDVFVLDRSCRGVACYAQIAPDVASQFRAVSARKVQATRIPKHILSRAREGARPRANARGWGAFLGGRRVRPLVPLASYS